VLLLEGGTLKEAQIFSQESRIRIEALERKEGAQALGSQRVFLFSEWPTTQGGMWGSIYSPHLKRVGGGFFHQTSPVDLKLLLLLFLYYLCTGEDVPPPSGDADGGCQ
jgi:hypothetical protein